MKLRRPSRQMELSECLLLQDRETKLVVLLIKRLQPYVDGKKQTFETDIRKEAEHLADSTFGGPMLKAIGCVIILYPGHNDNTG